MPDKAIQYVLSASDRTAAVFRGVQGHLQSIDRAANVVNGTFARVAGTLGGALAAGSLTAFFGSVASGLDRLVDLKDATGATIPNLSALEDVALRTGTSFDGMAGTLVKFNKVLTEADPGSRTAQLLKSIGLDAERLRKIDPAEALRLTAVALDGYADKGNKARVVQELFGKSIQEAGPFLAELAQQTELVGKVTKEQAEAAEQFNKNLAALRKNALDASRALFGDLVPALNRVLEAVQKFGGVGGAAAAIVGADDLSRLQKLARAQSAEMERLGEIVANNEAEAAKGDERAAKRAAVFRERLQLLQKQAAATSDAIKGLADNFAPNSGDKAREDRGFTPEKPDAPGLPDPAAAKARAEAAKLQAKQYFEFLESQRQQDEADERIVADAQSEAARQSIEARKKMMQQYFDFIDSEQEREIEEGKAFLQTKIQQLSDFALEARRNIQDLTGDILTAGLEGEFDRIDKMFGSLLKRMVAQALAADINRALFGKTGTAGDSGLLGFLFTAFGGARAEGGPVSAARPYLVGERGPEIFVPGVSGQVVSNRAAGGMGGGATIYYAPVTNIDARSDAAQVARLVQAENNRSQKALVDQLKAAGVIGGRVH